jgi:hypothetical protein
MTCITREIDTAGDGDVNSEESTKDGGAASTLEARQHSRAPVNT